MGKHTDKFYNRFSLFYPLVDIFLKPQKMKLLQEVNKLPPGRLLEIGVGNGKHLQHYKAHEIVGIDTSLNMLESAMKQKADHIELFQMNGESLSFQNKTFDYVILSHVIAVVDNPEQLLSETYRVLKPGGKVFILNHFTPSNWTRHIDHAFQIFSKALHFKSVFHIDSLTTIKKFTLSNEIIFGQLSYFRLLIYNKA